MNAKLPRLSIAVLFVLWGTGISTVVAQQKASATPQQLLITKRTQQKFELLGASDQQMVQLKKIGVAHRRAIADLRAKAGITKELIKRRDEAFAAAKQLNLKDDELWNRVQQQARLTDRQTEAFRLTLIQHQQYRTNALKILTAKQRTEFRKIRVEKEAATTPVAARPNILWITIEDWGPDLSCYGTPGIHTPNVDKLAAEGVRYEWAFTTSPVCSTSRSAMMTGFHQNYIRANQHREHNKRPLPHGIKPIPHLMKAAGYFTALMSRKTDCNFVPNRKEELFEGTDWKQRKAGQPFFARITFGGTHRLWKRDPQRPIDAADVQLPPYYADTEFVRRDWANGLEQMQLVDREVGAILKRLDDEGLADNTLVFFIGDHGRCQIRGKQFLYDGGIRIPMIVRWPGKLEPGRVSDDLASSLDVCATVLAAAGVTPPVPLHGRSLLDDGIKDREYVFAARDKMDETHDAMRAIRSRDFKLILNLMPDRPWCQYNRYKEASYPPLAEMNVLRLQGKLNKAQSRFFAATKPPIELFDLRNDPHEVHNVADDPQFAEVKATLLAELEKWRSQTINDTGVSDAFRAAGVYSAEKPDGKVDDWVHANQANHDFNTAGWPAWYPTRSLEQWQAARRQWEPWVFRSTDSKMQRPRAGSPETQAASKKLNAGLKQRLPVSAG